MRVIIDEIDNAYIVTEYGGGVGIETKKCAYPTWFEAADHIRDMNLDAVHGPDDLMDARAKIAEEDMDAMVAADPSLKRIDFE